MAHDDPVFWFLVVELNINIYVFQGYGYGTELKDEVFVQLLTGVGVNFTKNSLVGWF